MWGGVGGSADTSLNGHEHHGYAMHSCYLAVPTVMRKSSVSETWDPTDTPPPPNFCMRRVEVPRSSCGAKGACSARILDSKTIALSLGNQKAVKKAVPVVSKRRSWSRHQGQYQWERNPTSKPRPLGHCLHARCPLACTPSKAKGAVQGQHDCLAKVWFRVSITELV